MDLAEEERRITERMNKKWRKMQAEIEARLSGTAAPYVWDDDIPDYVRHYCDGYDVEYFGIYEGYDVYSVSFRSSDPLVGDDECIEGYPAFLLVARDGSGKAKQVSDVDFKICNATFDQVRKLRAAGHPKRKFPAYPRPQPQN